ncbi:hypothetical protein A3K86_13670 [Photobacterium jeanii]|uniref:Uncharacterized protein n=1 Tax=Photobacterium jeanii TaxID=858640 RepID=A0A178KAF7_9GAMM|nr:hypothetical protein [Photobacterium jeanii]OAN13623.1 hypothetical protein A3K86_13670 [Photobacterium jeanii]PST88742.1 hypothetical protein C9I91_15535 [Photobacterium jeanii]
MSYEKMTRSIQQQANVESKLHMQKVKEKMLRRLCEERGLLPTASKVKEHSDQGVKALVY